MGRIVIYLIAIAAVGAVLSLLVTLERRQAPALTVVVPHSFCGPLTVYLAYSSESDSEEPWRRDVLINLDGATEVLTQFPFEAQAHRVGAVAQSKNGGITTPLTPIRTSVSSWPYGPVRILYVSAPGCTSEMGIWPATSTGEVQRRFTAIVEGGN